MQKLSHRVLSTSLLSYFYVSWFYVLTDENDVCGITLNVYSHRGS